MLVTEEILGQIELLGQKQRPEEACGLVLANELVVEIENESPLDRTCNFHFGDLRSVMRQLRAADISNFMFDGPYLIWHTHPGGSIGPSSEDLRYRVRGVKYLVVSLTDDGPVGVRY